MFATLNITAREKELHYVLLKDTPVPSLPMHWHSEFEVIFVLKGTLRCLVESVEYRIEAGNAIIIAGGERHYLFPDTEAECRITRIVFSDDLLSGVYGSDELVRSVSDKIRHSVKNTAEWPEEGRNELNALISWLASDEMDRGDAAYQLGARGGVLLMLSLFLRYAPAVSNCEQIPASADRVMERIEKVFLLVSEKYNGEVTLTDAAAAAGYVPTYFSRIFREYTGMTFYTYLTAYRVAIAEYFLLTSDKSISDVAGIAGFGSVKTFDRIFKEQKGISPLKYRKLHAQA